MENCRVDISVNKAVSLPVDFLELMMFLHGDLVGYFLKLMLHYIFKTMNFSYSAKVTVVFEYIPGTEARNGGKHKWTQIEMKENCKETIHYLNWKARVYWHFPCPGS